MRRSRGWTRGRFPPASRTVWVGRSVPVPGSPRVTPARPAGSFPSQPARVRNTGEEGGAPCGTHALLPPPVAGFAPWFLGVNLRSFSPNPTLRPLHPRHRNWRIRPLPPPPTPPFPVHACGMAHPVCPMRRRQQGWGYCWAVLGAPPLPEIFSGTPPFSSLDLARPL